MLVNSFANTVVIRSLIIPNKVAKQINRPNKRTNCSCELAVSNKKKGGELKKQTWQKAMDSGPRGHGQWDESGGKRVWLMYLRAVLIVASLMFSFPPSWGVSLSAPKYPVVPAFVDFHVGFCYCCSFCPLSYIFFTWAILFALCYLEHLSLICFIKSSHFVIMSSVSFLL